ncbi:MAG: four helix bundle protein [Thermomicrobiales bacterium]|nr:four helix bundle protein [Thermomicrobiales bacterium]
MKLASVIYRMTRQFPREEQFGLTSQLRRCAVSVPSNIAEGHSRNQHGEFLRFLLIARGSLGEMKTQVLLAAGEGYLQELESVQVIQEIESLMKQISSLHTSLASKKPR